MPPTYRHGQNSFWLTFEPLFPRSHQVTKEVAVSKHPAYSRVLFSKEHCWDTGKLGCLPPLEFAMD